jgi:hypothetical protein
MARSVRQSARYQPAARYGTFREAQERESSTGRRALVRAPDGADRPGLVPRSRVVAHSHLGLGGGAWRRQARVGDRASVRKRRQSHPSRLVQPQPTPGSLPAAKLAPRAAIRDFVRRLAVPLAVLGRSGAVRHVRDAWVSGRPPGRRMR